MSMGYRPWVRGQEWSIVLSGCGMPHTVPAFLSMSVPIYKLGLTPNGVATVVSTSCLPWVFYQEHSRRQSREGFNQSHHLFSKLTSSQQWRVSESGDRFSHDHSTIDLLGRLICTTPCMCDPIHGMHGDTPGLLDVNKTFT